MKLESLIIIFAIIILPVIIILSYYIHAEIDTIANQTAYDTKLIDATHDAMSAFELNTANEELSSVSDALRSIIEASTNTFFNSLATNLGMSNANKSAIQSYVPSILYTLYDGYYIYSPTRVPEVLVANGEDIVYVGDGGVEIDSASSTGKKFCCYKYSGDEYYVKGGNSTIYGMLPSTNKYEFGQMLYKNEDNTYSTVLNSDTYYKQDYILKSYMPYSARYKGTKSGKNYDLTINYTLDNYITVMGYIGDVYYSKTGYLIGKDIIESYNGYTDLLYYNEIDAENICLSGQYDLKIEINPYLENGKGKTNEKIIYSYSPYIDEEGNALSYTEQKNKLKKLYENIENNYNLYRNSTDETVKQNYLNSIKSDNVKVQELESSLENLSAIAYYVKAQIFSNWVYDNLGNGTGGLNIQENNIQDDLADNNISYTTHLTGDVTLPVFHHKFDSDRIIFDIDQNPEDEESNFALHKYDVIRNSIQYNLNLALSVYDKMAGEMDIKMPVMSDSEWDKILNNISIVAFMQGFNCGLKQYNNYAIVSSTNNELTVIPSEIYYTKAEEYNTGDIGTTSALYHRIDCPELEDTDDLISFRSKEVKYDKLYDKNSSKYKYDHKNLACYNCIVSSNYLKPINTSGDLGYSNNVIISALSENKRKAYYRAVASARKNIYKTNALPDSNGYETLFNENRTISLDGGGIDLNSSLEISKIKAIEITFKDVSCFNPDVSTTTLKAKLNGEESESFVLNLQNTTQTITIPVKSTNNFNLTQIEFIKDSPVDDVSATVLNIRVIYK